MKMVLFSIFLEDKNSIFIEEKNFHYDGEVLRHYKRMIGMVYNFELVTQFFEKRSIFIENFTFPTEFTRAMILF